MDLRFTPEENAFRADVRAFMKDHLPPAIRNKMIEGRRLGKEDLIAWQRILNAKGWAVPHWPKQWGGPAGARWTYRSAQDAASAGAGAAAVRRQHARAGTDQVRQRGAESAMAAGHPQSADWWCQGYSEPGAGSDLASVKTRARRDGDHYIVNGQKTWTTLAQYADRIFCLVRTDPAAKSRKAFPSC